jgi:hypothetical protein
LPIKVKIPPSGIIFSTLPDKTRQGILLLAQCFALFGYALCGSPELINGDFYIVLGDTLHLGQVMEVG